MRSRQAEEIHDELSYMRPVGSYKHALPGRLEHDFSLCCRDTPVLGIDLPGSHSLGRYGNFSVVVSPPVPIW